MYKHLPSDTPELFWYLLKNIGLLHDKVFYDSKHNKIYSKVLEVFHNELSLKTVAARWISVMSDRKPIGQLISKANLVITKWITVKSPTKIRMGYVKDLLQSMRQVSSFGNAKDIRLTTSSLMECVSMIFCRVSLLGILNSFPK